MAQYYTALSELFLAAASFILGYWSRIFSTTIYFSLIATGLAAVMGMLRFSLEEPPSSVYRWHRFLTEASFIFTPSIFASSYSIKVSYTGYVAFLVAPIILFLTRSGLEPNVRDLLIKGLSGLSIIFILYVSYTQFTIYGILGCILLVTSSIIAQMEGRMFGFRTVDLFHYLLIPALYCLTKGAVNI